MSFYQLFISNLKILYRNWRGLFFTIFLPIALYIGLGLLKISTSVPGINTVKSDYSSYLLPGMIALTIMQTGIFSLAYWLIDLRQRGVLKRFAATPLSNIELISSLISTRLLLMLVQIILLTLIGRYLFGASVSGSPAAIVILMILGGTIFLTIGFLISVLAKSYDEASPITTAFNLIFTFLGNIFFPTEVFPKVLREIGARLPITYLADGMRHNFVEKWTLRQSLPDIIYLSIWVVVTFLVTVYCYSLQKEE